jgi:TatD DNase family protein
MTPILDIHTHNHAPQSIENVIVGVGEMPPAARYLSVGIHPWYADILPADRLLSLMQTMLSDSRVVAVGEAGFDPRSPLTAQQQEQLFLAQADMAQSRGLPLIIHAVKAQDTLLRLHSALRPSVPWIIHGFRGKPQQARQYLDHGIHLSFGEHSQPHSLREALSRGSLLFETDESTLSIEEILRRAARELSIPESELKQSVTQNIDHIFF